VFKWLSHGRQYGLPLPSGRIDWLCWSVVTLLVLTASPVSAQTWTLSFSPSASHSTLVNGTAVVTAYEYVITPAGGSALAVQTLGKPAPVNGTITVDISTYINGLTPSTCVGGCTAIVSGWRNSIGAERIVHYGPADASPCRTWCAVDYQDGREPASTGRSRPTHPGVGCEH
jgi:hypothetical protein